MIVVTIYLKRYTDTKKFQPKKEIHSIVTVTKFLFNTFSVSNCIIDRFEN